MDERKGEPASPEFREWFKKELRTLHRIAGQIIRKGEQHVPVLMCYEKIGRIGMMPVSLNNVAEKNLVFALHRFVADMDFMEGVIFVVESWIKVTSNPSAHDVTQTSISDDPAREEAIMFNCLRGPMQLIAYAKITRPPEGEAVLEQPIITDPLADRSTAVGRMVYNKPTEH